MDKYDGSADPMDHTTSYHDTCIKHDTTTSSSVEAFQNPHRTCSAMVPELFLVLGRKLPRPGQFVDQIHYSCVNRRTEAHLSSVKQKLVEELKAYVAYFSNERLRVWNGNESVAP